MNPKDFFKQLKDELHGHPFRDRFLEELEAHAEDLENDKELKEKFIKSEMLKKYLGEPKEIKRNFLTIMNPMGKLFFILEGLFYGCLTIPLGLVFFTLNKWNNIDSVENFSTILIGGSIGSVLFFILFFLSFKRYQQVKHHTSFGPFLWSLVNILPGLMSLGILSIFGYSKTDMFSLEVKDILIMFFIYFLINVVTAFLAWFLSKGKKLKTVKSGKILEYLKKGLLLYFGIGIILKTLLSYFIYNEPETWIIIIGGLFLPIFSIEYMFVFFWAGMMSFSPQDNVNLFTSFYFLIIILIFLALQSLWVIWKERKWFSFRGLIVLYVVSLFFLPGAYQEGEPEFKVQAVNISKSIEKNQLGIFYGIIKYFNQDEGSVFKYEVGFKEYQEKEGEPESDAFVIKNNTGNYSYIPYGTLASGKPEVLYNTNAEDIPANINLPDYYECDRKDLENCNMDKFVDAYILKERFVPLSDAAFSTDGKWGLIVLPSGAYDPDNVYLVKLK